jgi:hypothetical protein
MADNRPFVNDRRPGRYQSPFGETRGTQYRALCADGIVRTATATAEPDTFFTVPARVSVRGRTVSGFVSALDADLWQWPGVTVPDPAPVYAFSAARYGRNASALPEWPKAEL